MRMSRSKVNTVSKYLVYKSVNVFFTILISVFSVFFTVDFFSTQFLRKFCYYVYFIIYIFQYFLNNTIICVVWVLKTKTNLNLPEMELCISYVILKFWFSISSNIINKTIFNHVFIFSIAFKYTCVQAVNYCLARNSETH